MIKTEVSIKKEEIRGRSTEILVSFEKCSDSPKLHN